MTPLRTRIARLPWPLLAKGARVLLSVAATMTVALAVPAYHHEWGQAVLWTCAMLASFVGWGSLVNVWLAPDRQLDWGLRAGWGMAASIALGGFLAATHLVSRGVLIGQVAVGVGLLVAAWQWRRKTWPGGAYVRRRVTSGIGQIGVTVLITGAYVAVVCIGLGHLGHHAFEPSDDPPLYLTLPTKLMETGSLLEPFAARRASILGGHVYLHAVFLAVAKPYFVHAVDGGLCQIIALGLLVGHVDGAAPRRRRLAALVFAVLMLVTLRSVERNIGSLFSGIVAVLTLYRTLRAPLSAGVDRPSWPVEPRRVVALAIVALVPVLLRPSNAPVVLLFLVFVLTSDFLLHNRRPWSRAAIVPLARVVVTFAVVFLFALVPWSLMLQQSSGMLFFPFGTSNMTPGFSYVTATSTKIEILTRLVNYFLYGKPVVALLAFVMVGLVPLAGRQRNDLVALTLAVFAGMLALAREAAQFDVDDTSRWFFTYVATLALVAVASVRDDVSAAMMGLPLAIHIATSVDEWNKTVKTRMAEATADFIDEHTQSDAWGNLTADYIDIQSHVPRGATMATAVFENYRFDFQRNPIFVLDVLGGMGPRPGWPVGKGPAALASYLLANGIDYLVWVDFNLGSDFYNRGHWKSFIDKKGVYLAAWAPIQLDAEDTLDALPTLHKVVYRAHGMTVLDLHSAP